MNIHNVFGPLTTTPKQTVPVIHNASSKLDDIFLRLLQQNTVTEEHQETFQKEETPAQTLHQELKTPRLSPDP